jgi:methionine sulfoxide reductase heme-binding subunit
MTSAALESALWYLGRGAGVVTLVLLTLSLVLGIVTRAGRPLPGLPRFAVTAVHRSTSLLAVSLLAVHIGTLELDPQAQLRWLDAVLPFRSAWRPAWVGLGALAVDLLLALTVTSLLRHRIGRRTWRAVHWSAYATWPVAVAHSLGAGTDAGRAWFLAVLAGCLAVVTAAVVWRCTSGFRDDSGRVPGSRRPQQPTRPIQPAGGLR